MQKSKAPELHFIDYIAEANIVCGLSSATSRGAVLELATSLSRTVPGISPEEIAAAVMTREDLMPTVIAKGLAVPHARFDGLKTVSVALGTSPRGIDFNASSMPPVNIVVLVISPKQDPAAHLKVISALAKEFKNDSDLQRISEAKSPSELLALLSKYSEAVPDYITAMDLASKKNPVLEEGDSLKTLIETFATRKTMDIPIVDSDGDVRGQISIEDILKASLPEHLLWMEDLSPILRFQPFAELLKKDSETKLADIMRDDYVAVEGDLPAIQVAKIFLMQKIRQIIVLKSGKFAGTIELSSFFSQIFWE